LLFAHQLELVHQPVNVLNQDIVAGNQDLLLLDFLVLAGGGLVGWLLGRTRGSLILVAAGQRSGLRIVLVSDGLRRLWLLTVGVVACVLEAQGLVSVFV
jgi:hypothetical protein